MNVTDRARALLLPHCCLLCQSHPTFAIKLTREVNSEFNQSIIRHRNSSERLWRPPRWVVSESHNREADPFANRSPGNMVRSRGINEKILLNQSFLVDCCWWYFTGILLKMCSSYWIEVWMIFQSDTKWKFLKLFQCNSEWMAVMMWPMWRIVNKLLNMML